MPAGYYGKRKRIFHCSSSCLQQYYYARKKPLKCLYCGKVFLPRKSNGGRPYCSTEHSSAWRRSQDDKRRFGRFLPVVDSFLQDSKARLLSQSSLGYLRTNLSAFFAFVLQKRIRSLEMINPQFITAFLADHENRCPKSGGQAAIDLHTFFDWMIHTKRRKAVNPVVLRFHGKAKPRTEPRPFSSSDLARIRSMVSEDPQLKLAIEIGAESGLRISETCNLRIGDFDLQRQDFFVRLPNKTRVERFAPFHTRTRLALEAWLKLRPNVDHDFLFVGRDDMPLRKYTLRSRLNNVLCVPGGLASFSYHRLRHTASSALYPALDTDSMMRTIGWQSRSAMQIYTRVDPALARKSYARAMQRLDEKKTDSKQQSESIEAYFATGQVAK